MIKLDSLRIRSVRVSTILLILVVVASSMAMVGIAADGFTTTQTADSKTVSPGNNVTLTVTLENVSSDANAAGVDVGLPENWSIVSSFDSELENVNESQIVFSPNKTQYALIINSTSNTSFTFSYTVSVPASASEEQYSIAVNGSYYNSTENASIWDNTTTSVTVSSPTAIGGSSNPPTDPDDDGDYEDINGDGSFDVIDVSTLFDNRDSTVIDEYMSAFDFNSDDSFNIIDVSALFDELT